MYYFSRLGYCTTGDRPKSTLNYSQWYYYYGTALMQPAYVLFFFG
jgi:hypothetical protein